MHLEVLGVATRLRVFDPDEGDLVGVLVEAWSRCVRGPGAEPQVSLDVKIEPHASLKVTDDEVRGPDVLTVMDALTPLVTRHAIEQNAGRLLMLHAGAVCGPDGGTAILVGPSGAGKTTAALALGRTFGYLTDETAALIDDLDVLPYPKPLSVLPESGRPPKHQASPDSLGLLAPGPAPHPVRAVLLLDRVPDHAGPATLEPVATVDALPELAAQTSYSAKLERPLHRLAAVAQAVGGIRRVTYAEAADVIPVVSRLLGGTTP